MNLHRDHKVKVIKLPRTLREDELSHKSFEFNLTEKNYFNNNSRNVITNT